LSCRGERLDTHNSTSKLVLTILADVAIWEREIMLARQSEDIANVRSRRRGKYKGRTPTAACQTDEIRAMHANGLEAAAIVRQLGVARFPLASTGRLASWGQSGGTQGRDWRCRRIDSRTRLFPECL
jgi:DNA invertase Pin-like site-specific DNA recombinase